MSRDNKTKTNIIILGLGLFFVLASFFLSRTKISSFLFSQGNHYFNGGEYAPRKAKAFYFGSLFFDSKIPRLHYQLARIYFIEGNFRYALEEVDKELAYYPQYGRSYYVRGLINGYAKRFKAAEEDFNNFNMWLPVQWPGYVDLSWVYIIDGNYDKALETANKGLSLFPGNTWLNSNKGMALLRMGDYQKAKEALETAEKTVENISEDDWRSAYPGNNPADSLGGINGMRSAIAYNLSLVYAKLGEKDDFDKEYGKYLSLLDDGDKKRISADKVWSDNRPAGFLFK